MKNIYSATPFLLTALLILLGTGATQAQNLVTNSNFSGGSSSGWSTGCSMEINPETTYGGPSGSIYVTEIDVERCMTQNVCVIPGLSYTFTYQATRRPQSGTPSNPGIQVKVTGTSTNTSYVNVIQAYTNTTWNLQPQTFTITVPAGSADKQLNIQFTPNNNTTTYGVILSDIQMAPVSASPLSISGSPTTVVSSPNSYSLTGSPAGASYAWSFSADASVASSTSATPSNISWASMGAKTVKVALSNSVCTMATYSLSVNVSAILALEMTAFAGQVKGNEGLLTWTTAAGTMDGYFVIERSATGNSFDSVGVTAAMNGSAAYTYTFTDMNMATGNNYYRLRQVDNSGSTTYSRVIILDNAAGAAANAAATTGKLHLFPNPAMATLNYTLTSERSALVIVQVYSLSGALVMTGQQQMVAGVNEQSLNISSLRSGSYFVKITGAQGGIQLIQQFAKI